MSTKEQVIMTEQPTERHKQVNEYTGEECSRIQNEVEKGLESDYASLSPSQLRGAIDQTIRLVNAVVQCQHEGRVYVGAVAWCRDCGAIRRPSPTVSHGVPRGDLDWERSRLVERMYDGVG